MGVRARAREVSEKVLPDKDSGQVRGLSYAWVCTGPAQPPKLLTDGAVELMCRAALSI